MVDYAIDDLARIWAKFRHVDSLKELSSDEQKIVCDFIHRIIKYDPGAKKDFEEDVSGVCVESF